MRFRRWTQTAVAVSVVLAGCPEGRAAPDRNALWELVHDRCVVDLVNNSDPAPCVAVDLSAGPDRGYAVLKDYDGARQFLVLPTARVTGMESPALLDPTTPNYLAAAWRTRSFTEAAAGGALPRDWLSLAVNSATARSQDQLHIHVDCLKAGVHEALSRHAASVGPVWRPFPVPLAGRAYSALAVDGSDLDAGSPFLLLADGLPGARTDMGSYTVVVAGADRADGSAGFVLLAARVDPEGPVFGGEELQDHQACPPPLPAGPATAK